MYTVKSTVWINITWTFKALQKALLLNVTSPDFHHWKHPLSKQNDNDMKRHYQNDKQCQRCSDIYLRSTHLHGRRAVPVSDSWAAETWTQWPQREATDISPAFQGQKHVISWIWKKKLPEGSKCVCPAWCWITQSLKRLKRDGERGNEPNNKVHQNNTMLFMDTRLHRASDGFLTLSKKKKRKEDNILFLLRQLHVPFLS